MMLMTSARRNQEPTNDVISVTDPDVESAGNSVSVLESSVKSNPVVVVASSACCAIAVELSSTLGHALTLLVFSADLSLMMS